jgi:cytochrome c-type biogenesis protein
MQASFFAFVAGALTTLNPCVLPMIPFVVATSLRSGPLGPLALVAGMTVTFTAAGTLVSAIGPAIGLSLEHIRIASAIVMLLMGLVLLVPAGGRVFATSLGPVANHANGLLDQWALDGLKGQFATGMLLGLVWSPCSGPTLAGALSLAAQGGSLLAAATTMLIFSLGAGAVILALAYGAREVLTKRRASMMRFAERGKPIIGALFLAIAIFILTGLDKWLETAAVEAMPLWLIELTTRY